MLVYLTTWANPFKYNLVLRKSKFVFNSLIECHMLLYYYNLNWSSAVKKLKTNLNFLRLNFFNRIA